MTAVAAEARAEAAPLQQIALVDLLDRLKDWRRSTAKQQQVPAYVVFTDATLTAIAEHRPADTSALVAIPGIGANKLDRYGEAVLALIAEGGHRANLS